MMRKCSISLIDEKLKIMKVYAMELSQNLTSAAEFFDAEGFAKQYGGPIYKQGMRYSRLPTFHTVYDFFTIFCLGKKFSPYFPFHNVGRSGTSAKLLTIQYSLQHTGHFHWFC